MPTDQSRKKKSFRLAQRLAIVFLVGLVIPIAILSVLAYGQVKVFLTHQAEEHLRVIAKGYALGVYDRLMLAREELERLRSAGQRSYQGSIFELLGPKESVQGLKSISDRDSYLHIAPANETSLAQVFLVIRTAESVDKNTLWVAKLKNKFLWAETEQLPYGTQICVTAQDGTILTCGGDTLQTRPGAAGFDQLESEWALFLDAQFGHPSILFRASQPAHIALAVLEDMQSVLPLIAMLLLAILALFTAVQVRRQLGPLQKLVTTTRRLGGGDFAARLDVRGHDEFSELSESFNQMAELLQRRFTILKALRTVDRAVADQENILSVSGNVIQMALDASQAEAVGVAMFSESGRDWLTVQHRIRQNPSRAHETLVRFTDSLRDALIRPHGSDGSVPKTVIRSLMSPLPQDAKFALVSRASESSSVWVIACFSENQSVNSDNRIFIDQLADRLSIADELSRKNRQLYEHAHFDELTGLPNRHLLSDRMEQVLLRAAEHTEMAAVHFIDLDGFKAVNDKLGHTHGDEMLRVMARRLQAIVRSTDSVGRFGGDEFVVIQSDLGEQSDAATLAGKLLAAIREPMQLDGRTINLSASIGISMFPDNAVAAEDLLRFADAAMYDAKKKLDSYSFFRAEMDQQLNIAFQFDANLDRALAENEFILVYHPQIDLNTGALVGVEALLRWKQPDGQFALPDSFISLAEQSGRINAIGHWVVQQAIQTARSLVDQHPGMRMAINVAPAQLRNADFSDQVLKLCSQYGLRPNQLELEITEGALMRMDHEPEKVLSMLRDAGVSIALDDFGSGYSSLSYLRHLPVDVIKIDQLFMVGVADNEEAKAIVSTVVELGKGFRKRVIAEGIETEAQAQAIRELGVLYGQGFHFSKPLLLEDLEALLDTTDGQIWTPDAATSVNKASQQQ